MAFSESESKSSNKDREQCKHFTVYQQNDEPQLFTQGVKQLTKET